MSGAFVIVRELKLELLADHVLLLLLLLHQQNVYGGRYIVFPK